MQALRILALAALATLAASLIVSDTPDDVVASPPVTFHCTWNATCPEVMVAGDPFATLGGDPAPFRGYGDPSLESDPVTGTLWMSYSWLDILISTPGPPPVVDFGVRTHLARSNDGGATFTFVRGVNQTPPINHPDDGTEGWTIHEVSSLVREGPAAWQDLWLTYFDPFGSPPFYDAYYNRSVASTPEQLGDVVEPQIRGNGTSPSFGAQYNLSTIPELSDCAAFTEPALFHYGGTTYLATGCVVYAGGVRRDDLERLVLLRQETSGYSYIGELLDYSDALNLGATRIEQADLALSQNGAILLIATPINNAAPNHLGCAVFEVTDVSTAEVRRDAMGNAVQLAYITGDDSTIGPGLCAYDAASQTGVLIVLHSLQESPLDILFSLRATGVHPNGVDTDADGTADVPDPDDDNDGVYDVDELACGGNPVVAAVGPERIDGVFAGVDDDADGEIDEALPPGSEAFDCDGDGLKGSDEQHVYAEPDTQADQRRCGGAGVPYPENPSLMWSPNYPLDLRYEDPWADFVNIVDLASFVAPVRRINTSPGDAGYNLRWDLSPGLGVYTKAINLGDMALMVVLRPPMLNGDRAYGHACLP